MYRGSRPRSSAKAAAAAAAGLAAAAAKATAAPAAAGPAAAPKVGKAGKADGKAAADASPPAYASLPCCSYATAVVSGRPVVRGLSPSKRLGDQQVCAPCWLALKEPDDRLFLPSRKGIAA